MTPGKPFDHPHPLLILGIGAVAGALLASAAAAQTNFEPLERGDYTEEEERVYVLKGIEASLKYAMRLKDLDAGDASGEQETTRVDQDVRLGLKTAFHRDMAVHLVLEPFQEPLTDSNIRREPQTGRGRIADGQTLAVNAREAYLRYEFNPNSGMLFGRQEVSIADRKGMVFNGIVPAVTFDCRVGTWCFPFGAFKINESTADWVYHFGLTYRAWEERRDDARHALEAGVYRIYYTEHNVPLGRNNGPAFFNPDQPTVANDTQATDDADVPVYYDAHGHAIFGLNVDWDAGPLFWNLNFANSQGSRVYHGFRAPGEGIQDMEFDTAGSVEKRRKKVRGWALHTELGWRWAGGLMGLRFLHATGDPDRRDLNDGRAFLRGLGGYYELTPGAYDGTRLYFNGSDSQVDGGAGLGHSINNTRMLGIFFNVEDPETNKLGYRTGLYDLRRVNSVIDTKRKHQDHIGLEYDNMLIWFFHKSARAQFEINLLKQDGAFSYDDFALPDRKEDLIVQAIARIVYEF
jgi:hypothetical protein